MLGMSSVSGIHTTLHATGTFLSPGVVHLSVAGRPAFAIYLLNVDTEIVREFVPGGLSMRTYEVRAHWDAEAAVWWAESDDVPGLVAEARTHDALIDDLRHLVPELLMLNEPGTTQGRLLLRVISDQVEDICYA